MNNLSRGSKSKKSTLSCVRLNEFETDEPCLEDLWLRIRASDSNSHTIYLCVVYISPGNPFEIYSSHFNKVRMVIEAMEIGAKILMVGDYNLPQISWVDCIPRVGNASNVVNDLNDMINYGNLRQVNSVGNSHNSILDLVLTDLDLELITVREFEDEFLPVDRYHPVLLIDLTLRMEYVSELPFRRLNYRGANYAQNNRDLGSIDWSFLANHDVETATNKFYEHIIDIIEKHTPKRRFARGRYPFSGPILRVGE